MNFEWDPAKSQRNEAERGLHFDLAILLFDGVVIEWADNRQAYGEVRVRAIGAVGEAILHCVYTPRGKARRIITLRYANRKERDAYRATYPGRD